MTLSWLGAEDATIWHGDVLELLADIPDGTVQCVVTSPPYWGLRDYGVEGQIGLERTPGEYVARVVQVFREVRRVLRADGVCWLNLGDSYAASTTSNHGRGKATPATNGRGELRIAGGWENPPRQAPAPGLKPKDLVGIPWQVAFALRDDGWYLRMDNVWEKPNPMPEAVRDRTTKSHEYVFQLTKAARYYWDEENAKESASPNTHSRGRGRSPKAQASAPGAKQNASFQAATLGIVSRRNLRSVWTFTSQPYPGAHFATFPPELPRRCIRASTPEGGCCATCRRPYRRLVEKGAPLAAQQAACGANVDGGYHGTARKDYAPSKAQDPSAVKARILAGMVERKTIGWAPQCACPGSTPVPSLVLDPFMGSGTTLAVAIEEGRRALGLELNADYVGLAIDRIAVSRARGRLAAAG